MKFKELSVGQIFLYNNENWKKIKPKRISCCKTGANAEKIATGDLHKFGPHIEVELVS